MVSVDDNRGTPPAPAAGELVELVNLRLAEWGRDRHSERSRRGGPSLAEVIRHDADAFEFVREVFELVALPSDAFAAALGLRDVARRTPDSLPRRHRIAFAVGGIASLGLPWGVIPVVKQRFRDHLVDLIVSSSLPKAATLCDAIDQRAQLGVTADVLLLGEPVTGDDSAAAEAERLTNITKLPGATRITVLLGRMLPGFDGWTSDDVLEHPPEALLTVFRACLEHGVVPTLAPRTYAEALLAPKLLEAILDRPEFHGLRAGTEVLAELPESTAQLGELLRWARERSQLGRARPEVRISGGAALRHETTESIETGLAVPTFEARTDKHAQMVSLIELVASRATAEHLRAVVATESSAWAAFALELAAQRGADGELAIAVRRGLAGDLTDALTRDGVEVHEITPTVPPSAFAHSLVEMVHTLSDIVTPEEPLGDTLDAVQRSGANRTVSTQRTQNRRREWDPEETDTTHLFRPPAETAAFDTAGLTAAVLRLSRQETGEVRLELAHEPRAIPVISQTGFACSPDTDPVSVENRAWVRGILAAAARGDAGVTGAERAAAAALDIDGAVARAYAVGQQWSAESHQSRASKLRRAALALHAARDRLLEVIAIERGDPVHEIDFEINVAIDAARYLSQQTDGLRAVRGATFEPRTLTLVVCDEQVSLGELAETLAALLGAGSGIILAADRSLARTASVLIEEFEVAGLPSGAVTLVCGDNLVAVAERFAGRSEIEQLHIHTDASLASLLRRRRPDLLIDARVRGHGTVIVTPTADPAESVPRIVTSAFAGAGGHSRSARALILLGSPTNTAGRLSRLADAVRSLRVGDTANPGGRDPLTFDVGPMAAPPTEAQLRALTELEPGEEWLVKPEPLDDDRLWRPGIRTGVKPDAKFWADAVGVPVLGVTHAMSMSEAIRLESEIGAGAVASLHALHENEIVPWLTGSTAANLIIGRATTRARIERHPRGPARKLQNAPQPMAGGPMRLTSLGTWRLRRGTQSETLHLRGLDPMIRRLIETVQPYLDYERFDLVRRAALADALTWQTQLGVPRDVSMLGIERNVLRYRPVPVHVRFSERSDLADLVRVLAAGILARAPVTVSTAERLPQPLTDLLEAGQIRVFLERDEDWLERAAILGPEIAGENEKPAERIRLIGGEQVRVREWLSSQPEVGVWGEPVTMAGAVELVGFLREQAVTVSETRHGLLTPNPGVDSWFASISAVNP